MTALVNSMPKGQYRKATTTEIIKINDLLKKHLTKCEAVDPEGNPLYKYAPDWSDIRVGKEISAEMPEATVGRIRREMYGNLIGVDKRDAMGQRVDRLDSRLHRVEEMIFEIASQLGVKFSE